MISVNEGTCNEGIRLSGGKVRKTSDEDLCRDGRWETFESCLLLRFS